LNNYDVIVVNKSDSKIELDCSNVSADISKRQIPKDTSQQIALIRFDSQIDPREMYLNLAFTFGDSLKISGHDSAIWYLNTGFVDQNMERSFFNFNAWEIDSVGARYGDVRLPDIIYTVYEQDFDEQ